MVLFLCQPCIRILMFFIECPLPGYDFNLFLGNSSQPLHVILLTSSSLSSDNKDHTLSRLSDFSTSMLSSPGRSIIGLLLSEQPFQSATGKYNLDAPLTLQILYVNQKYPIPLVINIHRMMENLSVSIPVLPIPDSSSFFESVHEYLSNLADIPAQDPSTADSINLLSHTSSGDAGFLLEHDRNVLSDLFPSLKVMSQALQTQDGRDVLCDYLGEEKARGIVNFWANDSLNE